MPLRYVLRPNRFAAEQGAYFAQPLPGLATDFEWLVNDLDLNEAYQANM